jgi:hypothetical protein
MVEPKSARGAAEGASRLFGMFRRKPAIRDPVGLADFIDQNAAFLVQKGIYEYSRARAGHYAKVLFAEQAFLRAVEESRWRAYPLGLAMVAEMTEGVLRPYAGAKHAVLDWLAPLVLAVFDRYPVPSPLSADAWQAARSELAQRLAGIALHPRKRVIDIPQPFAAKYFALMPIHEKLRGQDFPTMRSYLQVSLCNIHDELIRRMDAPTIVRSLQPAVCSSPLSGIVAGDG